MFDFNQTMASHWYKKYYLKYPTGLEQLIYIFIVDQLRYPNVDKIFNSLRWLLGKKYLMDEQLIDCILIQLDRLLMLCNYDKTRVMNTVSMYIKGGTEIALDDFDSYTQISILCTLQEIRECVNESGIEFKGVSVV
jgi:hypothetical protein